MSSNNDLSFFDNDDKNWIKFCCLKDVRPDLHAISLYYFPLATFTYEKWKPDGKIMFIGAALLFCRHFATR